MTHFLLTFFMLVLIVSGMAVGAVFAGKRITGSCGGLNALSDTDKCLVCKQSVDPDSPLRERFECPKRKKSAQNRLAANQAPVAQPLIRR